MCLILHAPRECPHCGEWELAVRPERLYTPGKPAACRACHGLAYNRPPGWWLIGSALDFLALAVGSLALFFPKVFSFPLVVLVIPLIVRICRTEKGDAPEKFFALSSVEHRYVRLRKALMMIGTMCVLVAVGVVFSRTD